jgi:2-C-methyl-D-erythritol 2,4-cyclodiphosphate synthase
MRIGHGFDAHAFASGRRLVLGGVDVPHGNGLAGHSDGDVLTHAVIDALLGAAGLGDIGGMFPSSDERYRGADSVKLLTEAYSRVRDSGLSVVNLDATIVAEEPRLSAHVGAMRERLAGSMEFNSQRVSIKATTSDGLGFTGAGAGIAAFAVVLLE